MMKEAKKAFVVSMVDWISKDILRVIEEGKVPENWGGGGVTHVHYREVYGGV